MSADEWSDGAWEDQEGIPFELPQGERLLWQGRPIKDRLARELFHVRAIALVALACMAWKVISGLNQGLAVSDLLQSVSAILLGAVLLLGTLYGYAVLMARSTIFSITDKRVIIRDGVFVRKYWNVPFGQIRNVSYRSYASGPSGEICLEVESGGEMGYLMLWPYARPWRISSPQPLLRALEDGEAVARLLGQALQRSLAPSGHRQLRSPPQARQSAKAASREVVPAPS
ncbi:MAG: photosynthetic complex putative assembly protein PuhB [Pseudomonadota bacterium]